MRYNYLYARWMNVTTQNVMVSETLHGKKPTRVGRSFDEGFSWSVEEGSLSGRSRLDIRIPYRMTQDRERRVLGVFRALNGKILVY